MTVIAPSVHLNGTSKKELVEQLRSSVSILESAIEVMKEASPHMRDYYVQKDGDAIFQIARDNHYNRIAKVEAIIQEYHEIYEAMIKDE